ncbi:MAG TPA: plastocyanin/azurin family copper-binding protein [Gemmatimonadales bacterium]|jgi:adhesin/invasin|nr:plastocyanin/azurin family copper-binding protein [Gemmatimonadales bacterium]
MKRFGLVLFIALALVDCGGGGGGTGPTPGSIMVSAGNNQVGAAGTALPESLAVIVRDQGGAPFAGANVTFAITAGGGSVSPASRLTDAAGIAKSRRTLGPNAGTQTVTATAGSLAPVQFSAVSQINGAVNIANSTTGPLTDTVGATKAESLTVLVTDQNATPVQGVTVAWASSGGSVSAASVPTSAAGLSKVLFTYGTASVAQTATATVTGLVGSPVSITLNATAGTAVSIVKTAGDNGTVPPSTQVNYTVQSRDTHGNPKGGVTIDWAVVTGGGSITPAQNVTQANGNATAVRTLGSGTGDQTATATAAGLPGGPVLTFTTTAAIITTVEVANNSFTPNAITVPQGTVVTFEWQGTTSLHNVTFGTGGPENIPNMTSGSAQRTFNTLGTINYACTNHGGMNGTVTVTP